VRVLNSYEDEAGSHDEDEGGQADRAQTIMDDEELVRSGESHDTTAAGIVRDVRQAMNDTHHTHHTHHTEENHG
jgi:hypothetical protein